MTKKKKRKRGKEELKSIIAMRSGRERDRERGGLARKTEKKIHIKIKISVYKHLFNHIECM